MIICEGYCNKYYNENEIFEFKGRQYCEACYVKIKNDDVELQALKNYIRHIFKYQPNKMILNQINKYNKENGWSYKNIRLTLEYIVVVRGLEINYKYGIGLVPFYYDDMIKYHKARLKKMQEVENTKKKSKHVNVNKKKDSMHTFNKNRMVNMDDLEDDDE
ncbi:hypothetical protein [Staphylococcus phage SpP]